MKKLLLILLISLGLNSFADVTYTINGTTMYGDDGSLCTIYGDSISCDNGITYMGNGPLYGDDGSSCNVYGNTVRCDSNSNRLGYADLSGDAYKAGSMLGEGLGELFNTLFDL